VYLAMYEEMLGPYPYGKFATVENWFPTGYGMPSYTLLGGVVMRLPFIPYTSFGHEICHNWWGNSIFVGEGGNWCEGLTSYCADYQYKLQESAEAAREYRRNLLKDYEAYVRDSDRDFPLVEFESRHSGATRAVGYGKSMMVFHMLERLIGQEPFLTALRRIYADHRFQQVTWDHFFTAFTGCSGRDLAGFQEQWLTRTGAVFIQLERAERDGDTVEVRIRQGMPAYDLEIPLVVTTPDGEVEQNVRLRKHIDTFRIEAPGATRVRVDPDYDLFRKLHPEEIEPTLNQVLAEDVPLFILPAGNEAEVAAARRFAVEYTGIETPTCFENGQPPVDIRPGTASSFILLNPPASELTPRLQSAVNVVGDLIFLDGARYNLNEYDLVLTATNPHDPTVTDMVVICRDPQRLPSLASRVGHYGKYSWLLFPAGQGRAIRGNWLPEGNPLSAELAP
ncbi:MAG: M1 family aminopeptidase, partial [bacterium]